jgi:hypothetical protein
LINSSLEDGGVSPVPDVREVCDTGGHDFKIELLTSPHSTTRPEAMDCKRRNFYAYRIHRRCRPHY